MAMTTEAEQPKAEHPLTGHPQAVLEMVGIEIIPIGQKDGECDGGLIRLVKDEGKENQIELTAGLSGAQLRAIAQQLLTIADACSKGVHRTVMCVSDVAMWKMPGQALIIRFTPDPHYEFMIKSKAASSLIGPAKRKLIVPQ